MKNAKILIVASNELYHINDVEYEMMNWFDYWYAKVPDVAKTLDTVDLLVCFEANNGILY